MQASGMRVGAATRLVTSLTRRSMADVSTRPLIFGMYLRRWCWSGPTERKGEAIAFSGSDPRAAAKDRCSPTNARGSVGDASLLTTRVHALVGRRDALGAVAAVRESLHMSSNGPDTFSWSALSAALYACADAGRVGDGLSLVRSVRMARPHLSWTNESVLAVVLRLQCSAGDVAGATQVFTYLLQKGLLKPRTASLFLQFACTLRSGQPERPLTQHTPDGKTHPAVTQKDRDLAFAVYEACLSKGVELGHDDYLALGRLCVRYGEPPSTLRFMLDEMQTHVAEVSEVFVCDVMEAWLTPRVRMAALATAVAGPLARRFTAPPAVLPLRPPCDSPSSAEACEKGEQAREVGDVCQLACAPPTCPHCHGALGGYPLTSAMRAQLLSDLVDTVVPQQCRSRRARAGFEGWRRYVAQRQGGGGADRIDLLIDGANLGYYGLSSWYEVAKRALLVRQGRSEESLTAKDLEFGLNCKKGTGRSGGVDVGVNFALIDLAIRVAMAPANGFRRPLVLLHERHCEAHNMTSDDAAYAQRWRANGWLYCTPTGLNDDLCWLYAALELTRPGDTGSTTAHAGGAGGVDSTPLKRAQRPQGGGRPVYVLTNDLMRDHHFALLSPRCFSRWREQHQIRFRCAYQRQGKTEMELVWPPSYTRCIQRARGGECVEGRGQVSWHIPFYREGASCVGDAGLAASISGSVSGEGIPDEQNSWLCITYL